MSKFAVPLGFPGWNAWAFLGLPAAIYVDVLPDPGLPVTDAAEQRGALAADQRARRVPLTT